MNATTTLHAIPAPPSGRFTASRALTAAVTAWFVTALAGQWWFAFYIAGFYGPTTFRGDFDAWSVLRSLGGTGYVAGDTAGNLTFAAHALAAGIVALGGALQLVPGVRARAPRFHHWNGRIFLLTVVGLSLSGFYLVWVRGSAPTMLGAIATSFNGVLILAFALLAWRSAVARRLTAHRRWAIRLYLVSNAQWFMRMGFFAYFAIGTAIGVKPTPGGLFFPLWSFGCYLVPLAVAELYLRAKDSGGAAQRLAVAGGLVALTLPMALGMIGFTMFSLRIMSGAPLSMGG